MHLDSHDPVKELRRLLSEKGLRTTKSRVAVLKALKSSDSPCKVEQIRIAADLPSSQTVSVYRTLDLFCSLGLAQRLHLENGTQLFASSECCSLSKSAPVGHHHHVLCRECGYMEPLPAALEIFCQEAESQAEKMGFSEVRHSFEVYGLCPKCG